MVIGNPVGTLGQFTSVANGASTEMLGSITSGSVKEPQQAVGSTEQTLFNSVILRPWCALQFGDVDYCLSKPEGLEQSVADTWLHGRPDSDCANVAVEDHQERSANFAGFIDPHEPPGNDPNLSGLDLLAGHPERVEMISGGGCLHHGAARTAGVDRSRPGRRDLPVRLPRRAPA